VKRIDTGDEGIEPLPHLFGLLKQLLRQDEIGRRIVVASRVRVEIVVGPDGIGLAPHLHDGHAEDHRGFHADGVHLLDKRGKAVGPLGEVKIVKMRIPRGARHPLRRRRRDRAAQKQ
jgi:hypothetical protein